MKKVLLLLSFLWLPSALFSCGYSPTYNQFSLFFHPVSKDDKLYPFKFVSDQFFYNYNMENDYYHHTYSADDYKWNNQEWKKQLKTTASLEDINAFVYHYPYQNLKSLYYHLEKRKPLAIPDSMKQNGLTKYFMKKKDFETLGYLMYAKECEEENNKRDDSDKWKYESHLNKKADDKTFKLIKNGTKLFNAAKSDWVKKRYAFQFIRLAHYHREYKKADGLYSKYVLPMAQSNSLADYWLWGLRGGMLRRLKQEEKAAIWFAKTVVRSPDKYIQAYNDFSHIGLTGGRILPYCDNYLDSADVLFVSSLGKREAKIDYLEELYELQPNSKMLPLLMSRELAKLEQSYLPKRLLSKDFTDWSSRSYKTGKVNSSEYGMNKLAELASKILYDDNAQDKGFASNYLAYLLIARGQVDAAHVLLADYYKEQQGNSNEMQSQLLNWVTLFDKNKEINEGVLITFLEKLDRVSNEQQSVQSSKYHFLKYFVAPYFEKTKQPLRKAYALLKANIEEGYWSDYGQGNVHESLVRTRNELSHYLAYQSSFDELDAILSAEKSKVTNDPFIRYASKNLSNGFGKQSMINIITRKHIRNMNWKQALRYYKMGKPESDLYEVPTEFRTKEQCGLSHSVFGKYANNSPYNAETILELAQDLEAKSKKKKAKDLFNYGMLLYNFSYYGKLENLSVYEHRNYGVPVYTGLKDSMTYESNYYPFPINHGMAQIKELDNYFNLTEAQRYFQKAFKKLKSQEERAQCAFMLALCWQKTGDAALNNPKDYVSTSIQNPNFKVFKNDFGNTKTYQRAFGTCAYLRMFAKQ